MSCGTKRVDNGRAGGLVFLFRLLVSSKRHDWAVWCIVSLCCRAGVNGGSFIFYISEREGESREGEELLAIL